MNIGRALQCYRENANLTQGELAEKVGIKEETYCKYEESDGMSIRIDLLGKIAGVLGIDIVDILNKAEE